MIPSMNEEQTVMGLIVYAGNARSLAMEAIAAAKRGAFAEADEKIHGSGAMLKKAQDIQADMLIRAPDKEGGASMLMVHAQDHLMNAVTVLDLAREFCELYQRLTNNA
jgi:PTS system cellobiose-specific IIA component